MTYYARMWNTARDAKGVTMREELRQISLQELRQEIQKGIDSLERGEGTLLNMEEIKVEGRKKLAARHKTESDS